MVQNVSCCNNISYKCFQLYTRFIRSFKIIRRNRKVIFQRVRVRHCLSTKFITCYLILKVVTLHIYHLPSCTEGNICDGGFHCLTIIIQCDSLFAGTVRSKVVHINIHSKTIDWRQNHMKKTMF